MWSSNLIGHNGRNRTANPYTCFGRNQWRGISAVIGTGRNRTANPYTCFGHNGRNRTANPYTCFGRNQWRGTVLSLAPGETGLLIRTRVSATYLAREPDVVQRPLKSEGIRAHSGNIFETKSP